MIDGARWLFLDYAENFNDVFFMSLMFFISGLFVLPFAQAIGGGGICRPPIDPVWACPSPWV